MLQWLHGKQQQNKAIFLPVYFDITGRLRLMWRGEGLSVHYSSCPSFSWQPTSPVSPPVSLITRRHGLTLYLVLIITHCEAIHCLYTDPFMLASVAYMPTSMTASILASTANGRVEVHRDAAAALVILEDLVQSEAQQILKQKEQLIKTNIL